MRFNVLSERLLVILVGFEHTTCNNPKHSVHESYALPTELYRLVKQSVCINDDP